MRLLPYGADAVLVEVADGRAVPALQAAALELAGVITAIPGARTVLVEFDPARLSPSDVAARLDGADVAPVGNDGPLVRLPVHYDGADLAEVAGLAGCSVDDVISAHSSATYRVRFCGFSPGFAYLDGLPAALQVPRRPSPRTAVPAGSVAIAGEFTGVYPRSSPGGWQLLGRTDATLWDVSASPPALLAPGTRVRFEPT